MAEEFQAGICGENWWTNPSKSVFMGGLSPYSTVSIGSDHTGAYGSWTTADMVDLKARSISCKDSKNITTSASDTSIPFLNSQKPQQPDSDSGGSSILIDSTLQMMGFGLSSSSSSSSDWNQALLPGNGRTESYNSMMQEEMNSGGLNSSQIQKDWSPKSYTSTAEDFSLDQQRLNQVNSSTTSPQTCQGFSTGFSMEPSASYGYPSTLIQSFFDPENPQLQQAQSLFSNQIMNYLSPAAPNYGTNMAELSSPSWPKSQFLVPDFEEKSNCNKFTTKPSKEVRDSVSVLKKGSQPSFKRPRIETPSPLPTFKVRKEKLGDRITALQQLVSPFGKTDTASVLHEAIEYIKFLHDQVSVLSTPYMKNANPIHHQQAPADKSNDLEGPKQDLRSRGLCLVPVSSTFPVATETTADFWTPTFGGTFR
ncbi:TRANSCRIPTION FACTOR BHLH83-RELATED [Salix viminalis]|uniref:TRANSCRIPTION FACTOR BHLH83-RELATED n=1 Tax=Salix viminalis TaxID=40686 RepID=A0A9Q0QHR3_SALVM|nr:TRANSCRIPTION FACTOR BHLH83-RELATED [Salix viminalis]